MYTRVTGASVLYTFHISVPMYLYTLYNLQDYSVQGIHLPYSQPPPPRTARPMSRKTEKKKTKQQVHHIASAIQSQLPSHLIPSSVSKPSSSGGPGATTTGQFRPAGRAPISWLQHIVTKGSDSSTRTINSKNSYCIYRIYNYLFHYHHRRSPRYETKQNKTETKGYRKILS
jgi:hypothetical protein